MNVHAVVKRRDDGASGRHDDAVRHLPSSRPIKLRPSQTQLRFLVGVAFCGMFEFRGKNPPYGAIINFYSKTETESCVKIAVLASGNATCIESLLEKTKNKHVKLFITNNSMNPVSNN